MHLPSNIALLLAAIFIAWLFRRDFREKPNVTRALWLPVIWMLLSMSRLPSQWAAVLGLPIIGRSLEEGNPFDAVIYFALIVAGMYVLKQRNINLSEVLRNNRWIGFYFLFCFIAIAWSDFPYTAFKRWIKILGHPVMVLVVLTEPDPGEALVRLMKRTAYVILPVSILFIKYFEDLGRGFDQWSGEGYNQGITLDKNALGYDCLVLGFFFVWHFLQVRKLPRGRPRRKELLFDIAFLYMVWWLMSAAHSSTSLVSLVAGVCVVLFIGLPFINTRNLGFYLGAVIVLLVIGELCFGLSGSLLELLGKDATLTGRRKLWPELLAFHTNPIWGTGFESFWLGDRLQALWEKHWWQPTEAHNGYLEIYLNLGVLGLIVLAGLFVSTFMRSRRELDRNFEFGRFRLGFLAAVALYNFTESAFKGLHPVWFVFYIIAIECPQVRFAAAISPEAVDEPTGHENLELATERATGN